jgi:hypothetical protein
MIYTLKVILLVTSLIQVTQDTPQLIGSWRSQAPGGAIYTFSEDKTYVLRQLVNSYDSGTYKREGNYILLKEKGSDHGPSVKEIKHLSESIMVLVNVNTNGEYPAQTVYYSIK